MDKTPKSLRLHIGLFGRTNVGKSSFLNMIAGQDVAIVSPVPGTTTDVVEKTMELLPVGPVVFLDTAGINDRSELGALRVQKTHKVFERADLIVLLVESGSWGEYEDLVLSQSQQRAQPLIVVVNKADLSPLSPDFRLKFSSLNLKFMECSSIDAGRRNEFVHTFKQLVIDSCPEDFLKPLPLVGDLLPAGGMAVLIVPIDLEAPKGRLILPQVQAIRDCLDNDAAALVVKEREFSHALANLKRPPDLVVCDSQVVLKMVADTPASVPCTTFSILFARLKGDLVEAARGAAILEKLKDGDKVLIAEACSHHPIQDDIGRVKIPRWLRQFTGADLQIDVCGGKDFPQDLKQYKLVIHCGACMFNRREMLSRIEYCRAQGVPITNYGVAVSVLQGVAQRTLAPFPSALEAYRHSRGHVLKDVSPVLTF